MTAHRLAAASLAILVSLAAACRGEDPAALESRNVVGVTTAAVQRGALRDVANVSGMVVPSPAADLTVYATEHADVVELPKKAADAVAVGDILVRFEIASLTQERSAVELETIQAASRLDRAKADLARQTSLFERGITSRNAYDASRLEQSAAEAGLAAATARAEALDAGQNRAVVRATFPGVVAEVWHAAGDAVRPGNTDPILRVVDPTRVQVAVQLPIAQLARIVPGQTAIVRAIAGAADEAATVVAKSQGIDPSAPTGEVRLAFSSPATLPLNTPVSTEILLDQRTDVLIVPTASIARDDLGPYVMVAGTDNVAQRRDVRSGLSTSQFTQITTGVEEGEHVILAGLEDVVDGTPIVVSR